MKRDILRLLIGSIALVMIALIGLQYYWVDNALDLKRNEFDRNASEALKSVADFLEKKEMLERIKSQEQGRFLFIDDDVDVKMQEGGQDTTYEYALLSQYERSGNLIEYSLTEKKDGKTVTNRREVLAPLNTDSLFKGDRPDFELKNIGNSQIPVSVLKASDDIKAEKLAMKKAIVGDIVKSLMEVKISEPIEDRIADDNLDSLLKFAFAENGISTEFIYAIFDGNGKLHYTSEDSAGQEIAQSKYRVNLFPNDLIGDLSILKVYFPRQTGYLLRANSMMVLSSMIIVLVILYIFYWSVRAIISQKRNSEIKNDFINNMTHELKTPISTISLACEVLSDPAFSSNENASKRYIGMISEENKRLGMLVEEVLQSAVLDKGDFKLKLEDINLNDLLMEVTDKMSIKAGEKKGRITYHASNDKEVKIQGDKVHLDNVFYNLIDNAIKYTQHPPEVNLSLEKNGTHWMVKVQDNGIGISKENQKKVFERLYRVPTGNRHDVKGFGLGLNYVSTIIKRHQGKIDLESTLGHGSTFTVYLPQKEQV